MGASRQITGWRAIVILLGGITVVVAALAIAMYAIELPITNYPSYAAVASDSVGQSWLPPFLPRDAVEIREVHDLDTEERWIAFRVAPGTLHAIVSNWSPLPWPTARRSVQDRPWRVGGDWPPELSTTFWHTARDTHLLSYHRDAASGWCLAVEWPTGRAWGWTCERVG